MVGKIFQPFVVYIITPEPDFRQNEYDSIKDLRKKTKKQ